MPKRRWDKWPQLFGKSLTRTSGFVGLAGIGISALGATVAAPVILGIGFLAILGSLGYAGYCSIPPKMLSVAELVGTVIELKTLEDIDPPVLKLGIVGYTQSGKTTFLKEALHQRQDQTRTNRVTATILALHTTPMTYIALLDGDGEQISQQFDIAECTDALLVFLDHNQSDNIVAKSKERIKEHERFLRQLEFHIRRRGQLKHMHLLLNKRDLWEKSKSATELRQWFEGIFLHCRDGGLAMQTSSDTNSNMIAADVGKVVRKISDWTLSA